MMRKRRKEKAKEQNIAHNKRRVKYEDICLFS